MSHEQVIEKIKALLSLATGEGNENEKKLALQRAQELMAKYSVDSIDTVKPEEIIEIEIIPPEPHPIYFDNTIHFGMLVAVIAENFGCYPLIRFNNRIFLMGFKSNLEISKYAIQILLQQGISDFKEGYRKERSIGFSGLFWQGFCLGMKQRFTKISNEKALILYDKVKQKWDQIPRAEVTLSNFSGNGFESGKRSAREAILNPAVSEKRGNLLT